MNVKYGNFTTQSKRRQVYHQIDSVLPVPEENPHFLEGTARSVECS